MKTNLITSTLAALALAATFQTAAFADDPISPVQGAVCNLYLANCGRDAKSFNEIAATIPSAPAAATFVDMASDFKPAKKKVGITSSWGMWTGWLKQEKAGTYTFTCRRNSYDHAFKYSIWINGVACVLAAEEQSAFNVELTAGFNSVKILAESYNNYDYPLSITYKRAGSVKDPVSFGPADMWYDDEE